MRADFEEGGYYPSGLFCHGYILSADATPVERYYHLRFPWRGRDLLLFLAWSVMPDYRWWRWKCLWLPHSPAEPS